MYPMYLPAPPPSAKEERKEPTTTTCNLGLGLGVLQEPGVQPPAQPTHTHPHTPGNRKLNSTFHFPLSLLYRYLPTTGYKYVYSVL